jgi:predicted outer membrane repeat protein
MTRRLLLASSLLLFACGREGEDTALADASLPGTADDAGVDASTGAADGSVVDAGEDAAVDAGDDAGTDAGDGATPPGECGDAEVDSRPCGLNARGVEARSCNEGTWSEWSACVDPDECVDAELDQRVCGVEQHGSASRTCTDGAWSEWSACDDPDVCVDGAQQEQACGLNQRGVTTRSCVASRWTAWSSCVDSDECLDASRGERACGLNGRGTTARTCAAGAWGQWSTCADPDACTDGRSERQACGLNQRGQATRTCVQGHFGEWSACEDTDVCVDRSDESMACGLNRRGRTTRSCDAGQWQAWSACADPDECSDGAAEAVRCGLNQRGQATRSCDAGHWSVWSSCVDSDECVDEAWAEEPCGLNLRGRTQRSCDGGAWGEWSSCIDPDVCVDGETDDLRCGLNGRGTQRRSCVDGAWGSPSACVDPDECTDGRLRNVACGTDDSGTATETCQNGSWTETMSCSCAWGLTMDCAGRCVGAPARLHVRAAASGCEDGRSWATAFSSLSSALAGGAHEVWVAEGTYHPGPQGAAPTSTFRVDRPIWLIGGFAGDETAIEERDIAAHPTVLDGDLDRDLVVDRENAFHVVMVSAGARIDGFTIRHGYASRSDSHEPGSRDGYGGGMFIDSASPTIENCRFEANQSVYTGGGMYIRGASTARVVRSVFERNRAVIQVIANGGAQGNGGAMGMDQWPAQEDDASKPTIAGCDFIANVADGDGGAMSIGRSSALIVNNVFRDNAARDGGGGAIRMFFESEPAIAHCTFAGNRATSSGGALYGWYGVWATVSNSIFWDNGSTPVLAAQSNNAPRSRITVTNSIVQGGYTGTGNRTTDPLLDGALRPTATSPALNAGASSLPLDAADLDRDGDTSEPLPIDHDGAPRTQGAAPDMGAFEVSGPR